MSKNGMVTRIAKDTFHSSATGTVPAGASFETHEAHAKELDARGLTGDGAKAIKGRDEEREQLLGRSDPQEGFARAARTNSTVGTPYSLTEPEEIEAADKHDAERGLQRAKAAVPVENKMAHESLNKAADAKAAKQADKAK